MKIRANQHFRDPLFQYASFACCALIVVSLAFYYGLYRPAAEFNSKQSQRLEALKNQYSQQHKLSEALKQVSNIESKIEAATFKLRQTFNSVSFSADMEKITSQSGVKVISQSYSAPRDRGEFSVVEVKLRVSSSYKAFRTFLNALKEGAHFIATDRARIESRDNQILADLDFKVLTTRSADVEE